MTILRKPKRRRHATKRLNLEPLARALQSAGGPAKLWVGLGVVALPEGESSHWELVEEDGQVVDILVDVELMPNALDVTCRLGNAGGGAGRGIWAIPAVGDEVIVAMPAGELAFAPSIVAVLSSGNVPNPSGEGPAAGRTIIMDQEVLIHDGTGGTDQVVLKSAYEVHKHGTGTGPSSPPDNAAAPTSYSQVVKVK